MPARALKNLLLLLVSLVIAAVILELGIRFFVSGRGGLSAPRPADIPPASFTPDPGRPVNTEQYDPHLGWVNKPGVSGTSYGPDSRVSRLEINSRGLRERDIGYQKPAGAKRIAVLGDSFAWGYGLKPEERFSDILDRDFPATQVINMGVMGYGTDQECTLFEREGIKYGPDLVILLVHDTDIFHNGLRANYGKAKPYFTLRGDKLERHGIPVPRAQDSVSGAAGGREISTPRPAAAGFFHFLKKDILSHSRLYALLSSRLKMLGPARNILEKLRLVEPGRTVEEDVRLTGAIVDRLGKTARAAGAEGILVLIVPSKEVINYHLPGGAGKKFLLKIKDEEIIRREEAVRSLSSLLKSNNIPVIDLTGEFIDRSARGTNLYFIHDNHWNEEANKIAAVRIGAFLRQNGYN
ncbi:MAG: hypothetical protein V1789_09715 [PVC group bacterium]